MFTVDTKEFRKAVNDAFGACATFGVIEANGCYHSYWTTRLVAGMEPNVETLIACEFGDFKVVRLGRKYYQGELIGINVIMEFIDRVKSP